MKILLVDDHALFREGMKLILNRFENNPEIYEAFNCDSASSLLTKHSDLDLVLLDLNLAGDNGFSALKYARQNHPLLPVVVLSASHQRQEVQLALDSGAMGFISKDSSTEVMLDALKVIFSGGIYTPPFMMNNSNEMELNPETLFTPRQREVLVMIVAGESNKLIASTMDISEHTIKKHITEIFKKLGVTNRTQAALAAAKLNIT